MATHAPVPRALLVRPQIQIQGVRLSRRLFLLALGGVLLWAVAALGGADAVTAGVAIGGAVGVVGIVLDARLWGRPIPLILGLLVAHLRRPRRLVYTPPMIVVTPAASSDPAAHRPRWLAVRDRGDQP